MSQIVLIVFAPLVAAIVGGLGNRMLGNTVVKSITTGALFLSAALSWPIFLAFVGGTAEANVVPVLDWVRSGDLVFDWALRVDALTAVMLVVITTVSALVHLYSWGYMEEDPDQPRFFAYLSLFTFAMLMLVTADNLVQMFFGWEGVGLASYLLIGFWFRKPSANAAAIKAFVVNRVGDLGFMLGIFGTFLVFGTVSIPEILEAAPSMSGATIGFLGYRVEYVKLFAFVVSAIIAGIAGALYVPQVGIINPSEFDPANSIEVVIWTAVGGRGTIVGPIIGGILVNVGKSYFTGAFPEYWLFALGALFVVTTLFLPKGIVGLIGQYRAATTRREQHDRNAPTPMQVEAGAGPQSKPAE